MKKEMRACLWVIVGAAIDKTFGCDDTTLIETKLRQGEGKEERNTLRIVSWIWFGRSTSGEKFG
jgi:hypothetical protein